MLQIFKLHLFQRELKIHSNVSYTFHKKKKEIPKSRTCVIQYVKIKKDGKNWLRSCKYHTC